MDERNNRTSTESSSDAQRVFRGPLDGPLTPGCCQWTPILPRFDSAEYSQASPPSDGARRIRIVVEETE